VLFWYRLISLRATVPGLYLCGFLTPPVAGALFLAAFVANCFRGAFPPVLLRAVCLVLAIFRLFLLLDLSRQRGFEEWRGYVQSNIYSVQYNPRMQHTRCVVGQGILNGVLSLGAIIVI
jgi:hypothetical protein